MAVACRDGRPQLHVACARKPKMSPEVPVDGRRFRQILERHIVFEDPAASPGQECKHDVLACNANAITKPRVTHKHSC